VMQSAKASHRRLSGVTLYPTQAQTLLASVRGEDAAFGRTVALQWATGVGPRRPSWAVAGSLRALSGRSAKYVTETVPRLHAPRSSLHAPRSTPGRPAAGGQRRGRAAELSTLSTPSSRGHRHLAEGRTAGRVLCDAASPADSCRPCTVLPSTRPATVAPERSTAPRISGFSPLFALPHGLAWPHVRAPLTPGPARAPYVNLAVCGWCGVHPARYHVNSIGSRVLIKDPSRPIAYGGRQPKAFWNCPRATLASASPSAFS
jgi:hypothetical protein